MARLRGEGLGTGLALGTAAVVRMRNGIPMLPEVPERIAQLLASRRLTETPEVVLIAPDYRTALAVSGSLSWGKVVAIAAEHAEEDSVVPPFPAVVNVSNLAGSVRDDVLILVDARNGVVLVDPDPVYLGQYTSEHARIAPRHRFHLEETHLPAQTQDGRAFQVIAAVTSQLEIGSALEQGADALFVPFDSALLPLFVDAAARKRLLFELVDRAAGKPLIFFDEYSIEPLDLLVAGAQADITVIVPPREGVPGLGLSEWTAQIQEAQEVCLENEIGFQTPRLGADITMLYEDELWGGWVSPEPAVNALAEYGAVRLHFQWHGEDLNPHFREIMAAAEGSTLPILAGSSYLPEITEAMLRYMVGAGVYGFICPPGDLEGLKGRIRELSVSECRETLWQQGAP